MEAELNMPQPNTQPLRILWVVSRFQQDWTGGVGRIVAEACTTMSKRGHEVHVAGSVHADNPGSIESVTTHIWPKRKHKIDQVAPLLRLVKELKPDLIHFHSAAPHGPVILPFLAWRGRDPLPAVVLTPHSAPRAQNPRFLSKKAIQYADGVIACSRWSAELAVRYAKDPSRVRFIPHGIHLPSLDASEDRQPFIFSISRLGTRKGLDVLIEAFSIIADAHPEWTLRIAGDGSQEEELWALAKTKPCSDRIQFLGTKWGDEKEELLLTASIGAVPSRNDNLPGTMMEFQAYGVATVATTVGGIPDLADNGKLAKLVPPENPVALAQALEELIENPELRSQLARDARHASTNRSWDKTVEGYEAFYRELIAGRS